MSTAYELDRKHVFHSWSAQAEINPMVITRAEGSHVWDADDKKYLDFSSQLVFTNLGHQHPRIVAAIREQGGTSQEVTGAILVAGVALEGVVRRWRHFTSPVASSTHRMSASSVWRPLLPYTNPPTWIGVFQ